MKLIATAALAAASVALVGCGDPEPTAFTTMTARIYCTDLIKDRLRDPDSYRVNDVKLIGQYGSHRQFGNATILFRSKNGFGGYVNGNATCTAYNLGDGIGYRAVIN